MAGDSAIGAGGERLTYSGVLQVKFELVSEEELEKQRKDFRNGELRLRIDEEELNMRCGPALLIPIKGLRHSLPCSSLVMPVKRSRPMTSQVPSSEYAPVHAARAGASMPEVHVKMAQVCTAGVQLPLTTRWQALDVARRLYNDFVDSVAIQTQALRETQAVAIADQQKLDEESLQRIKEEDSKAKVWSKHPGSGAGNPSSSYAIGC